jgi:hypothetical protein
LSYLGLLGSLGYWGPPRLKVGGSLRLRLEAKYLCCGVAVVLYCCKK